MGQYTSLKRPERLLEVKAWQDLARIYLDIVEKLSIDFGRTVNCSIYALDFAELHVYMHRHRSMETRGYRKFNLIDYILRRTREPDTLTLLPPTVFEIIRYMIQVSSRVSRLSNYRSILDNRLIRDFYNTANERSYDIHYYRKLLSKYKLMNGVSPILLIGTKPGFKEMIGDPLSKFIALIENEKLVPIDKKLESQGIEEFDQNVINERIYGQLLDRFQRIENRRDKAINNKVDAMSGAMVYELLNAYYPKNEIYSNLLTHSKHCLDVMSEESFVPSSDPRKMPIVRDPGYFVSRILCWELTDNDKDRQLMLKSIQKVLRDIVEAGSAERLFSKLKSLEEKKDALRSAEFFERIFVYDNDWGNLIRKTYSQLYENSWISDHLAKALEADSEVVDLLTTQPFRDVEILRDAFKDIDDYAENLAKHDASLKEEIAKLYDNLVKFISQDYQWGELTSSQLEIFQRMEELRTRWRKRAIV